MATGFTLVLGFLGAAYAFFAILLRLTQHSKEPPVIAKTIPFISPLFGFVHGMQNFLVKLRDQYDLPIYTLRMPGQRVYIVNSLSLIPQIQKQIKTIAFAPIEAQAADAVMGVGPAGNAIIGSERMFEHDSYLSTFVPSTQPALSPGPGLDAINGAAIRHISNAMKMVAESGPTTIELFAWVRHEFFMATTESIYGPKNPFRDPKLEQAWYLLARKGLHAREQLLIPAFEQYFAENGHLQGSVLVQCRYKHNTGHGLRGRDLAATEIGQMVASLANSIPAAFWLVYHIFSDPAVLRECREEAKQLVQADGDVDLAKVKSACPVLLSTWQETLRYMHIGIAARVIMEDVILDNQYLLKKGATLMTAAPVQHTDPSLWGADSGNFQPSAVPSDPWCKTYKPCRISRIRWWNGALPRAPLRYHRGHGVRDTDATPLRHEACNRRQVGEPAQVCSHDYIYATPQRRGTSSNHAKGQPKIRGALLRL
ncbi:cytochrome P450 [Apiospora rasikravindrae]|uniref:Cytochrome P450 n=1 Tax=Apiospora rasikravindrae TaxID=990691 RepID=A0ABR1TYI7_9PEZI